jgi:hypothetical protein
MKVVFISIVTTPRGSGPCSALRGDRVACAIAIEQGHDHTAMRHLPRVVQLVANVQRDLAFAFLEAQQLRIEQVDERNVPRELHQRSSGHRGSGAIQSAPGDRTDAAVDRQDLPGDVLAGG